MNEAAGEGLPWRRGPPGRYGSFTRPNLVIPCRVAFPQSPTLLHQARGIVVERERGEK